MTTFSGSPSTTPEVSMEVRALAFPDYGRIDVLLGLMWSLLHQTSDQCFIALAGYLKVLPKNGDGGFEIFPSSTFHYRRNWCGEKVRARVFTVVIEEPCDYMDGAEEAS